MYGRLTIPVLPIFTVLTIGQDFTPSTVSYLEYDVVCECIVAERFCNALLSNQQKLGGKKCIFGAFAKFRKASVSFVVSVRLSTVCTRARIEQPGSHWTFITFDI